MSQPKSLYAAGNVIIVKTWDEMVKMFGLCPCGNHTRPYGIGRFVWDRLTESMLPRNRQLTIENIGWHPADGYSYSINVKNIKSHVWLLEKMIHSKALNRVRVEANVHDMVRIKTWDRMVAEFGGKEEYIRLPNQTCFIKEMEALLPQDRIVTITRKSGSGDHVYSVRPGEAYEWRGDMFEEVVPKPTCVDKDGNVWTTYSYRNLDEVEIGAVGLFHDVRSLDASTISQENVCTLISKGNPCENVNLECWQWSVARYKYFTAKSPKKHEKPQAINKPNSARLKKYDMVRIKTWEKMTREYNPLAVGEMLLPNDVTFLRSMENRLGKDRIITISEDATLVGSSHCIEKYHAFGDTGLFAWTPDMFEEVVPKPTHVDKDGNVWTTYGKHNIDEVEIGALGIFHDVRKPSSSELNNPCLKVLKESKASNTVGSWKHDAAWYYFFTAKSPKKPIKLVPTKKPDLKTVVDGDGAVWTIYGKDDCDKVEIGAVGYVDTDIDSLCKLIENRRRYLYHVITNILPTFDNGQEARSKYVSTDGCSRWRYFACKSPKAAEVKCVITIGDREFSTSGSLEGLTRSKSSVMRNRAQEVFNKLLEAEG